MAEIVVSAFFTVFFEKLASEALKKLARSKGIDSELKKLKRSLIQIKALLNDAAQKEIGDEAVKEWLNGLQHLAYDIDDVLDDLATEAMHHELTEESEGSTSMISEEEGRLKKDEEESKYVILGGTRIKNNHFQGRPKLWASWAMAQGSNYYWGIIFHSFVMGMIFGLRILLRYH